MTAIKSGIGTAIAVFATAWLLGCGPSTPPCQGTEAVSVFCDFAAPEDLEVLPGDRRMLVSEYGGLAGKKPGTIKVLDLESGDRHTLYPHTGPDEEGAASWGDPACGEEIGAVFAPHGIHLSKGDGGEHRLLVVNHGKRESIEMFELREAGSANPSLHWRGCVVAPDDIWLNDVASLPGGGFVASHMTPRGSSVTDLLADNDGSPTGYVVVWDPTTGWNKLEGSDGALTNGVQTAPDGKVVFANYTLGNKVIAVDRATGERLWEAEVEHPDNTSWAPDGRLVVASIRAEGEEILECVESNPPFCTIPFAAIAIDPVTGETSVLAEGGGGPPFGLATVAVQVGSKVYMGSAAGQRIGVVDAK